LKIGTNHRGTEDTEIKHTEETKLNFGFLGVSFSVFSVPLWFVPFEDHSLRTPDLIRSAVGGLWRQKARTALTLLGVAVGTCTLAFSLSLGFGLRQMIDREFQSRPTFWQVYVHVAQQGAAVPESVIPPERLEVEGSMSDARRERLRQQKVKEYQDSHSRRPPVPLTRAKIAELAALPDVTDVITWHSSSGRVWYGDESRDAFIIAGRVRVPTLEQRLVAGRLPTSADADEMVLSEYLLYELGAQDDAQVNAVLNQPLRVAVGGSGSNRHLNLIRAFGAGPVDVSAIQERALEKVTTQLPKALDKLDLTPGERAALRVLFAARDQKKNEPLPPWMSDSSATGSFRVVGVVRAITDEEEKALSRAPDAWLLRRGDVFLPAGSGDRLFEQLPWVKETGFTSATVQVRPGGNLRTVAAAVEDLGLEQSSAVEWYDAAKREVTLIAAGLNLFALLSLFIAALGITNTLVTTVIERTREVGILKALGATDRQVMILFLAEGAVIGVLGGVIGLAMAWGLSIPGDRLVRNLVQQQSREPLVSESVFEFPGWLLAATVLFAVLVTTLAALYPSRRAARIQPVEALRHE
jgi:putative ABC transport system permease protein